MRLALKPVVMLVARNTKRETVGNKMAHGYAGMASFVSLQMGLVWVVGCIILFSGAYLIGAKKGVLDLFNCVKYIRTFLCAMRATSVKLATMLVAHKHYKEKR